MKTTRNMNKCHPEGSKATKDLFLRLVSRIYPKESFFALLRMTTVSLMLFISMLSCAQKIQPDTLLSIANNAYNQGLYDSALTVYHQVEKQNLESVELYYNMGNSYFKKNNIPSAILYYEKAKKLSPNDEDIDYNLRIANSMIVDKIERVPELFYKQWWNYFYNFFNADTWTIISIISWIILIFFIGLFIVSKSRKNKKLAFYFGVLFLLSSIATFGFSSQKYYYGKEHHEAIIFTPTITVKSSPTLNAVDLFVVHEGTKIHILDQVQDWIKIRIPDGSIGWLPAESVKKI
jgi:tetratricopeptide (TPR) repeat protein